MSSLWLSNLFIHSVVLILRQYKQYLIMGNLFATSNQNRCQKAIMSVEIVELL